MRVIARDSIALLSREVEKSIWKLYNEKILEQP